MRVFISKTAFTVVLTVFSLSAPAAMQSSSNTILPPVIALLLSGQASPDRDGDGVLNEDDAWPDDNTLPILSGLWGAYGEQWLPSGRLPFVGMAGYHDGEDLPQINRVVANVANFGASNTPGSADDTQAFIDAIAYATPRVSATNPGVIYVPNGVYDIGRQLHLGASGLVLRGGGRETTKLQFTTGVANETTAIGSDAVRRKLLVMGGGYDAANNLKAGQDWQHWNVEYSAALDKNQLPARGAFSMRLENPLSATLEQKIIAQGHRIRLAQNMQYGENSTTPVLAGSVYGGSDFSPPGANGGIWMSQQFIVSIDTDKQTLHLDRPLRFAPSDETHYGGVRISTRNMASSWNTREIGVEHLSIVLPATDWDANGNTHFGVFGQGGIDILSDNSWVRDVRVVNADNGIELDKKTFNNTLSDIVVTSNRKPRRSGPVAWRYDAYGHHGITVRGRSHLVKDIVLEVDYVHNLTMNNAHGCVITRAESPMTNMDHHRQGIFDSLWSEINLHDARRMWNSTGNPSEGYNAAAYNTYWNLVSDNPLAAHWPEDGAGVYPQWGYHKINIIATDIKTKPAVGQGNRPYPYHPDNAYLETMKQNELWPPNIYEAQRDAYRRGLLW